VKKFVGDWMTTGDQGVMSTNGRLCSISSAVTTMSSPRLDIRIGPGEIEDCLIRASQPSRWPPRSASPTRCAPRSSRPYIVLRAGRRTRPMLPWLEDIQRSGSAPASRPTNIPREVEFVAVDPADHHVGQGDPPRLFRDRAQCKKSHA
jgi:acetyl-CoA synthetase